MREILFRGKRKDGGIWLLGDLRQWSKTRKGICDYALKSTSEVDPETVGQFTGRIIDGVKLFEGDIVLYTNKDGTPARYKTAWDEKMGAWMFKYLGGSGGFPVIESFCNCVEIIGNIHDNPELLEAK